MRTFTDAFFGMRRWQAIVLLALAFAIVFPHPDLWSGKIASDGTDTYFFSWVLSHHWRQWAGDGFTSYFDTGILAPFPKTLLFSEFGILHAILGWPAYKITGSPFAAYCFVNVFGLALTAAAMFRFAVEIFKNQGIAFWAALAFTFSAYEMIHIAGHLQMACGFVFPAAFHALLMWCETRRRRWLVYLTLVWTTAFYFNVYYFVFLSYSLPLWGAYLAWKNRAEIRQFAVGLLLSTIAVGVLVGWMALQYYQVKSLFPNIVFPPSAREMFQLDFGSLFRSSPDLLLGRDQGVNENVSYAGFGILALILLYFGVRIERRAVRLDKPYVSYLSPAFLLVLLAAFFGFSLLNLYLDPPLLKLFGIKAFASVLYLALAVAFLFYLRRRPATETYPEASGFFALFAIAWFFIALGTNFFGGWQPFNWFLSQGPLIANLRAIGRLAVLVSFGLVMYSGYILAHFQKTLARHDFAYKNTVRYGLALALIVGTAELLYGSHHRVSVSLHDPTAFLTESKEPGLVRFYEALGRDFPEAPVYELPTRSWGDQLRVYQYGATFRDTLVRFQGLSGFTPEFFSKTIALLHQEDFDQRGDWPTTRSLITQLPVRLFIVHLDGATQTSPRILEFLRSDKMFKRIRELKGTNGQNAVEVYEKQNDEIAEFGLVPHPVLNLALRDYASTPARNEKNGEAQFSCEILGENECRFSLLWPYSDLIKGASELVVEAGGAWTTTEVSVRLDDKPLIAARARSDQASAPSRRFLVPAGARGRRLHFAVKRSDSTPFSLRGIYLSRAPSEAKDN